MLIIFTIELLASFKISSILDYHTSKHHEGNNKNIIVIIMHATDTGTVICLLHYYIIYVSACVMYSIGYI